MSLNIKTLEKGFTSDQSGDLIARFRTGEQDAFTLIYNRLYERLYWFGRRFVEEQEDVEDILAEAYIKAWKKREEFENEDAIAAFLHVVVRNQCLNLIKHRQVKASHEKDLQLVLEEQQPGDFHIELLQSEFIKKIFDQIDQLPPKMREIFLLTYKDGLKPSEIADRLQLKVQTVKNQRITALKVLKQALSQDPGLFVLLLFILRQHGKWLG